MAVRKNSSVKRVVKLTLTGLLAIHTSIFAGYVTDKVLQKAMPNENQERIKANFGVDVFLPSRTSFLPKEDYLTIERSLSSGDNSSLDAIFVESKSYFAKSPSQQLITVFSREGLLAFYDSFTHFTGFDYISVPFIREKLLDHEIAHARSFKIIYGSFFKKSSFRQDWDRIAKESSYLSFWPNLFYQFKFSGSLVQRKLDRYNKDSFINSNAASNVYEDVAEMIVHHEELNKRIIFKGSVLERKVELLREYKMIK